MGQCMIPVGGSKIDLPQGFYGYNSGSSILAREISTDQSGFKTNTGSYTVTMYGSTFPELAGKRCYLIFTRGALALITNETTTWTYKGYTITSSPIITDSGYIQLNNVCGTTIDIDWGSNSPFNADYANNVIIVPLE